MACRFRNEKQRPESYFQWYTLRLSIQETHFFFPYLIPGKVRQGSITGDSLPGLLLTKQLVVHQQKARTIFFAEGLLICRIPSTDPQAQYVHPKLA